VTNSKEFGIGDRTMLQMGHLETALIAVVVREFRQRQAFVPTLVILKDASSKHIFQKSDLLFRSAHLFEDDTQSFELT
jgi:hypothetical protein